MFLSPSYGETWGSQEDTEAAAVDSPRSWAEKPQEEPTTFDLGLEPPGSRDKVPRLLQSEAQRQSWAMIFLRRSEGRPTWYHP